MRCYTGGDKALYLTLAIMQSFLVGIISLFLGLIKAGYITNLISHSVLNGFTNASAILIASSQLPKLLGYSTTKSSSEFIQIMEGFVEGVSHTNLGTALVSLVSIVLLAGFVALKKTKRKLPGGKFLKMIPGGLVVIALAVLVTYTANLSQYGVKAVGKIPGGFPTPFFVATAVEPATFSKYVTDLLPSSITIAVVGYIESIAVGKVFGMKYGYIVDSNQELIALGKLHVVSSHCLPYSK
jgi:SulP family sulfate permease